MGVGIYLAGRCKSRRTAAEKWLQRVADWINEDLPSDPVWRYLRTTTEQGQRGEGEPALFVGFYPANEPVEFFVPEPRRMIVSAKTSILGPGYHIALCQILKRMGEGLGITWEPPDEGEGTGDETGYFHTGDKPALEEEMLKHLRTMAGLLDENFRESPDFEMSLSMPMDHSFEGGPIKTIVGVRDRAWLGRVQADARNGIDLFPWWEEGLTPRFYLGRAIVEMCMNVRWRVHPLDGEEWMCQARAYDDLHDAFVGDPSLPIPWHEWAEMRDYLDRAEEYVSEDEMSEEIRRRAAEEPERPLLGYRRRPVRVSLGHGWSIAIDGAMSEQWKDSTWSAWDGERTVWFSCWNVQRGENPVPADELLERFVKSTGLEGKPVELDSEGMIGRGAIGPYEEDGEQLWNLKGLSAVDGRVALCNLYYRDEADREWAMKQWHALTCARG